MYRGVQGFQLRKNIFLTAQILSFFEIGETLMLDQKKIKLNFKKRRLKEKDLLTIMINIAKFFKNKLQLSLSKGYKIKVDKNSYILFKKEEDYEILIYLERVFFDLFKNLLFNDDDDDDDDEDKEIRVFFVYH